MKRSASIVDNKQNNNKHMQITIVQISNGWVVTVSFPGKGGSSLHCTDFEDVIKKLTDMKNAAKKEHEASLKN